MLRQSDVAHYLLSIGVVKPSAIVDHDFWVADASQRNRVFIANGHAMPAYVVKEADHRTAPLLEHEAAVLRVLAATPDMKDAVPSVVHHEPSTRRLVLSSPPGGRNWREQHDGGRFPVSPPRALGRTLAALHRLPPHSIEDTPPHADRMWGLSLPEPSHELIRDLSGAAADVVARLQSSEFVCRRLRELAAAGTADGPVHGDLRWENCLLVAAPGRRRRTRVLLVDWELAGRGPAAFDVGTVFAEYLCRWIASIPVLEPRDPGRFVAFARHPLEAVRPAIGAFWDAYRAACDRLPALASVVDLAAVRLVQAAVERAQDLAAASAHVVLLLQVAANMLRDPEAAAVDLLGLRA